mgnify:FL=1
MTSDKTITLVLQIASLVALAILWWLSAPIWTSAVLLVPAFVVPLLQRPVLVEPSSQGTVQATELARHLSHTTTASACCCC